MFESNRPVGLDKSTWRIEPLALPASGFENFTFARYRPLLLGTQQPESVKGHLAVGAWMGETPSGLAFYSRPYGEHKQKRRLLSVMTSQWVRRQGVAARLLARGETLAQEHGTKSLAAVHSSGLPAIAAYEALLRKAGWDAPDELEFRIAGKANWALQAKADWAPFLARIRKGGFSVTPWRNINEADREAIANMVGTQLDEADRAFDPFKQIKKLGPVILPELSLLLRRKGEIVGWILGSRGIEAGTFHYSSGYALPAVRRAGWLIGGVCAVCERQIELFGGESISVFETSPQNRGMRRFMDRQLNHYSSYRVWTDARYLSKKTLGPE